MCVCVCVGGAGEEKRKTQKTDARTHRERKNEREEERGAHRGFRVERELAAHVGKVGPVLVVAQLAAVEDEVASLGREG
jgi:hypothetical protein